MDILLTNDKIKHEPEILDLEEFLHQRMTPLVQNVRMQLEYMAASKQLLDSTRNKIQRATFLLDTIDEHWESLPLESKQQCHQYTLQQLEYSFFEFSDKYCRLEQLQGDYFDDIDLNNTMDSLIICIEQMDTCIREAIDKAADLRYALHEKLSDFTGVAHDEMDQLESAVSYGAMRLLTYEELPVPWRNNMHIHTGYRFLSTAGACFRSWFYLHNESGNIYTHLLGLIFFFAIGIYQLLYSNLLTDAPKADWVVFIVFFLAVYKCLICSTLWHTLSGINDYYLFRRVACLDYVGISALICASLMLSEYYGFYCSPLWRNTYLFGSGSLALIGMAMPLMPWFDRPESQWIKIVFFVALASSGFIPIFHMLSVSHVGQVFVWMTPVLKSIVCYVLGVIIYSNRFPERYWPGKFDYVGHSHQWWHLFVCAGIWWNYMAAKSYVSKRHEFGMCPQ